MAILKNIRERIGKNLERNVGGLLGESLEGLSEEERRAVRRQAAMALFESMAQGTTPGAGLERVAAMTGARMQARRQAEMQGRAAQDIQQAQAAIAGRLGARGADVGEQTQLEEVRPMSGMNLQALLASPAGAAAAQANPQLAEMLKQRTGQQVVGGSIYDRETGRFITPPPAAAAVPQRAGAAPGAMPAAERFRILSPENVKASGFPEGTVVQEDTQTGSLKVLSAVPASLRSESAGKNTAVDRVERISKKISNQLSKVKTGGIMGASGALSRVLDSNDARLFESYRQQLSAAVRAALRIRGEGALSDYEQRQYGLQLPELGQSKENNISIIESLIEQVRIAAGMEPAVSPVTSSPSQGVDFIYQNGKLVPARKQ